MLEIVREPRQPRFNALAQRMIGLHDRFGQQTIDPVQHRIDDAIVQPGQLQDAIGPPGGQFTDQRLVLFERFPRPAQATFEQRHVPSVRDGGGQHLAQQRRGAQPLRLTADRAFQHAAQPFLVQRMQHISRKACCPFAQARLTPDAAIRQKCANRPGKIERPQPPGDNRRGKKIAAQKIGQRVSDAILVLGNDRGVRDRQAERATKQRGHREPVGQPADHGGFAECEEIAPCPRVIAQIAGQDECGGHRQQQATRHHAHAPRPVRPGIAAQGPDHAHSAGSTAAPRASFSAS